MVATRQVSPVRLVGVLVGLLALLAVQAPDAFAHASFLGSEPEPGLRLEASPPRLVLNFTEPLNERLTRARLVGDRDGGEVETSLAASRERLVVEPATELATGPYRVEWHSVSTEDGHALEGSFSFGVRAAATGGEHAIEQSPLARDGWVRVLTRASMYATLLLFVGMLLLRVLIRERGAGSWLVPDPLPARAREAARPRERRLLVDLGLVTAAAAALSALAEAADAAGGLSARGLRDFLLSNTAGVARVMVVLLVLLAGVLAARRPRAAALPAALALGAVAASGHASSASPRLPSVVVDWVHLLAGAVWVGGIALVVLVWWPALRRSGAEGRLAVARRVLPAFGRVALPAFIVVVGTGIVSSVVQLGHVSALWQTSYGRVLLVKLGLVAAIAAASYLHAVRLRPRLLAANPHPDGRLARRHWRLVRAEPALGLGVAATVALLAAFPLPPRQLGEAEEARAAAPACDPCPQPAPEAHELAVAEQAGSGYVAAWLRRTPAGIVGELRALDIDNKPSPARVTVAHGRSESCGRACWRITRPGTAPLRLSVETSGRRYRIELPARWREGEQTRALRLLRRAEATMRRLRAVRESERVTSGPGSFATTEYRVEAPDRLAYRTGAGTANVTIGRRQWFRPADAPWLRQRRPSPFRSRSFFRWTPYARAVRLLEVRRERSRRVAELALMDPGTPIWQRLVVDLATHRVLRGRLVTGGHYMRTRFYDFNEELHIVPPRADVR